jgi:tetratricopeptide (TPR) repeat protein
MSSAWIEAKWWFWTGWAKTRRKDFLGALSNFERVLHLFPDNIRALSWAAHCLSSLQRYEEALPFLDRALQNRPDYASAHAQLGRLLLRLGRKQESLEALTRAFRISPQLKKKSVYLSSFAMALAGLERKQEAITAFKVAAQLDPNNSDAQAGVGWGLFDARNFTEALEPLRKAVTLAPDYDFACDLLAQTLRNLGRDLESLPIWERLVALRPTDADAHAGLGWALQAAGRFREGLASLKKAQELDPTLLLDYSFALSHCHLHEYQEAIAAAERGLARGPDADAWCLIACSYIRLAEYERAILPSLKALELNPALKEALYNLGDAYFQTGQTEKAVAALERLFQLGDDVSDSHLLLGLAYLKLGNSSAALRQCELLHELDAVKERELRDAISAKGRIATVNACLPNGES